MDDDIIDARGTKRTCQSAQCGARFYDLNRDPIVCPLCQTPYIIASSPQAKRDTAPEKPKVVEEKAEETKSDEGVELVSLEDAEVDVDVDEDADDTFLEEDEDDDAPVEGIVATDDNEEES